ncbi:type III pantothenate kinase [Zoogloea sp.]|uniref:type III pantothenate kinase n=1 Tax=Zoogloea sp. TaxID=49181 RepID=UPI001D23848A|nr:type III pantothenate kinase [Zoogloea sp.]MBK6656456.1 type III pantothenate kinase [Zoogloea sp.]MBK7846034.1 type III pantothenate kinase [Zoogloea sp.]
MDLLLDVGNTRLKWGLHDGVRWCGQGAVLLSALDGFADVLAGLGPIRRVLGANVAGATVGGRLGAFLERAGLAAEWIRPMAEGYGVRNAYLDPSRLGADRWAALVGARAIHGAAALVVTSGTATTADVLDGQGVFQGGVILPGLDLMRLSLARDTAQLPYTDGRFEHMPRRTADAIQTGCLHAQLGAIERMFRLVAAEPGSLCLLNGGAAASLAPLLECPLREVDNLVLEGLTRMLMPD